MNSFLKKAGVFIVVAALIGGLSTYAIYKIFYPGQDKRARIKIKPIDDEEKFVAAGRTNIVLLGVDSRAANGATGEDADFGRSDTIVVAMYDPEAEKTTLLSIPRDLRVRVTNTRWDKINHSYNYGGAPNVVAAIESLLGIQIDYYAKVDFKGFERMVDAVGGVNMYIERHMYYEDPWDGDDGFVIDLAPGEQLLDGRHALQFVRYRDFEGDLGRVKRQQDFLRAAYIKLSQPAMWGKLPDLANIALESVETNLDLAAMLKIARTMNKNSKSGIRGVALSGEPVYINGINYLLPDIVTIRSQVAEVLGVGGGGPLDSAYRLARLYENSLPVNVMRESDMQALEEAEKEAKKADEQKDKEKDKDEKEKEKPDDKTPDIKDNDKAVKKDDKPADTKPKDAGTKPKTKDKPKEKSGGKAGDKAVKQLRAAVVNCSGNPDGGKKMEAVLENNGISVVSVSSGAQQKDSAVVSNTYDSVIVSRLAALPFKYSLRLTNPNNPSVEAVVYVGKDFM